MDETSAALRRALHHAEVYIARLEKAAVGPTASAETLRRASNVAKISMLQMEYSLWTRDVEAEILPYAREHGIGVIAYSPMASGLLTGTWTKERRESLPEDDWRKHKNPLFQDPAFDHGTAVAEVLREVGAAHGATPAAVA